LKVLGLTLGLLLISHFVLAADNNNYYLLAYYPGGSWNERLDYQRQTGLAPHHAYLKELYVNDVLVMGGSVDDRDGQAVSLYLLRTGSIEEAEKIASRDPGVQTRLLKVDVTAWIVTLSSVRFIKRRLQAPDDDPDQPFSIKRLDPNSRLNIEN
jgi:uncharacterized protein YciI